MLLLHEGWPRALGSKGKTSRRGAAFDNRLRERGGRMMQAAGLARARAPFQLRPPAGDGCPPSATIIVPSHTDMPHDARGLAIDAKFNPTRRSRPVKELIGQSVPKWDSRCCGIKPASDGGGDGIRTRKSWRTPASKAGAVTNFATPPSEPDNRIGWLHSISYTMRWSGNRYP